MHRVRADDISRVSKIFLADMDAETARHKNARAGVAERRAERGNAAAVVEDVAGTAGEINVPAVVALNARINHGGGVRPDVIIDGAHLGTVKAFNPDAVTAVAGNHVALISVRTADVRNDVVVVRTQENSALSVAESRRAVGVCADV